MRPILPLALAGVLAACSTVPITGRQQLMLVDEGVVTQLGEQAYARILEEERVSQDPQATARVRTVGRRVAAASGPAGNAWDFTLLDNDEQVNAFALPGGNVAVYTGMLRRVRNDAQLAFVIAHEIGHVIARHSGERLSQDLLTQAGLGLASVGLGGVSPATAQLVMGALGLGAQFGVLLPYSREHEYEADRLGMLLMAQAGYDPREAIALWQTMAAEGDARGQIEWLSTHPTGYNRVEAMQAILPEALALYQGTPAGRGVVQGDPPAASGAAALPPPRP